MILAMTGLEVYPFVRLMEWVDRLARDLYPPEQIIVQSGASFQMHDFKAQHIEERRFIQHHEIKSLIKEARIIVTHAGTGSVIDVLSLGKTPVIVPRFEKHGEHLDDHQVEFSQSFSQEFGVPFISTYDELLSVMQTGPTACMIQTRKRDLIDFLHQAVQSW